MSIASSTTAAQQLMRRADVTIIDDVLDNVVPEVGMLIMCILGFLFVKFIHPKGLSRRSHGSQRGSGKKVTTAAPPALATSSPRLSSLGPAGKIAACLDQKHSRDALDLYVSTSVRGRVNWSSMESEKASRTLASLCIVAAGNARMDVVAKLLREMKDIGIPRTSDLYANICRIVTGQRHFRAALSIGALMREDGVEVADRSIWSCLLFAASEEKENAAALGFFAELRRTGVPSAPDYGNACRVFLAKSEPVKSAALIAEMRKQGLEPYRVTYQSTFLALCAGGLHLDLAEELFKGMQELDGVCDAVTYNILIKGYSQQSRFTEAFARFADMRNAGIEPSPVTFGILLNACVAAGQVGQASELFQNMLDSGCEMNTILFTTIIKGFAKGGRAEEALHAFDQMLKRGVEPDRVTFSILIKGLADAKKMKEAFTLFETMLKRGIVPDEVVFNCLLSGCVASNNTAIAEKLLVDMMALKIRPTITTISTLLKVYCRAQALKKAAELVKTTGARYGVPSEQRLYVQFINSCLSIRAGQPALEALAEMIELFGAPSRTDMGKMVALCTSFDLHDVGLQIISRGLEKGGSVSGEQLHLMCESARRKGNDQVLKALEDVARKYGISMPEGLAASEFANCRKFNKLEANCSRAKKLALV